jgi:hypothetical protein
MVERVTRRMGAIKKLLESASGLQIPQNRVQANFDEELATGQLLESGTFQKQAGWTRQALSKAVNARRVFFLEVQGVRAYPAFYLDLRYNRKDLEAVTRLLGDLSGVSGPPSPGGEAVGLTAFLPTSDQAEGFCQRCGSNSSMRLLGWLGSRSRTSFR